MFSGIVSEVGKIVDVIPSRLGGKGDGRVIKIKWNISNIFYVGIGDSVAVNGVCLTVTSKSISYFTADVSAETLSSTTGLVEVGLVNIEKSLKLGDIVCGHLVSGHVDGIAKVRNITDVGDSKKISLSLPKEFSRFVSKKGSIALDGVSLTINEVEDYEIESVISINLIPHTLSRTNFFTKKPGMYVNFEVDMMARTLDRLLAAQNQ
ncbi:MAG: hypothetical protein CBC42_03550 [Betaproteobacteria bacterium TMED82]|nr:MAG: hypothetical protein CBC42_03550 [Betaproteobacteria bacterium TMED82]|tara:strand:- start:46761 stop:47381 length:621 start_codon:yes stop_codon:yes gene_type:complete